MYIKDKSGREFHLPSPEEDQRINMGIDEENPELDDDFFQNAMPATDVLGHQRVDALVSSRKRGRPVGSVATQRKEQVSIRLSQDVLEHFRSEGPGWQTRIDAALRDWLIRR